MQQTMMNPKETTGITSCLKDGRVVSARLKTNINATSTQHTPYKLKMFQHCHLSVVDL
jgi:hypothetical protein